MARRVDRQQAQPPALRVAMVSTPFVAVPPPRYGGTELVVAELVDGLLERGVQVTLFATGDSTGGYRSRCAVRSRFEHAAWPPSDALELEHCAYALQALIAKAGSFDLVHAHCASLLPFASMLGMPMVYTLHHHFRADLARLYQAHPEVTYVSISRRQLQLSGPFPRSAIIHHGIDPARYRLGTPRKDTVAFLGRLSQVKGPHIAVDVARRAGLKLRVGGRAHEQDRDYFRTEVSWRLRQDHVEYLGELSHEPKVALLSTARALLFPIDWEEPFGLVAIEAMLCGCPVVAFGRGAIPEIVEEGVTGFVARDPEHMAQLLHGPAAPERFDRQRCRERAEQRFSTERMTDDYLAAYRLALRSSTTLEERAELPPA
ncbi:MAG TPA: glycosyltransferase family 4 protein [Myxococcales bacterium]|jgi:glycosyltransferase involved in cell wall biosynthesis